MIKRVSGEWQLVSYKRTNNEGMVHYVDASGILKFNELKSAADSSRYTFQLIGFFEGIKENLDEEGSYRITKNGELLRLNKEDQTLKLASSSLYRILTLTNTDLELELSTETNLNILLFRKK